MNLTVPTHSSFSAHQDNTFYFIPNNLLNAMSQNNVDPLQYELEYASPKYWVPSWEGDIYWRNIQINDQFRDKKFTDIGTH